jgi:carbonic anhydrase
MLSYEKIFENNRKWVEDRNSKGDEYHKRTVSGKKAEFLLIGCSDSRVPLESIMGAEPGEIFVHRNIANVVSRSDTNILSAIEFAIKVLEVKHIVVCGHTECIGVKSAMSSEDEEGNLGSWLSNVRYVIQKNSEELYNLQHEDKKYKRLLELNIIEQCNNISSLEMVKSSIRDKGTPSIHAWIYEIETGKLRDLNL